MSWEFNEIGIRFSNGAYTNMQRANIEYDFMHGVPLDEICETYGIAKRTLRHLYQRWGMSHKDRLKARNERIVRDCKNGYTSDEVAYKYDVSRGTVNKACRDAGFSLKIKRMHLKSDGYSWRKSIDAWYDEAKSRGTGNSKK